MMNERFPNVDQDVNLWMQAQRLIPHARKVLEYNLDEAATQSRIELLLRVGRYEYEQANHSYGETLYKQALTELEEHGDCVFAASWLVRFAQVALYECYITQQRYREAEELGEKISHRLSDGIDSEPSTAFHAAYFLFLSAQLNGDASIHDEIEQDMKHLGETTLADAYGSDDVVYNADGFLGALYLLHGKLDLAEGCFGQLLRRREMVLGLDHVDTINNLHFLAFVEYQQGRCSLAEGRSARVLKAREERLGPNHLRTLDVVLTFVAIYQKQGRLNEAKTLYKRCLEGLERRLGSRHFDTLRVVRILAHFCFDCGRYDDSEVLYDRALAGEEAQRVPNPLRALKLVHDLGVVYNRLGKQHEAEPMFHRVLEESRGLINSTSPDALVDVDEDRTLYFYQHYDERKALQDFGVE